MKRIAVLWMLMLAGCQTDADVRSKPPLATYSSSKSLDAMTACLVPALAEHYNKAAISNFRFVAQIVAPNFEYDVVPTDGFVNGHYTFTVNVKKAGAGTQVALYKGQPMLASLTTAMQAGIKSCL